MMENSMVDQWVEKKADKMVGKLEMTLGMKRVHLLADDLVASWVDWWGDETAGCLVCLWVARLDTW
jgi:hypothetical protein